MIHTFRVMVWSSAVAVAVGAMLLAGCTASPGTPTTDSAAPSSSSSAALSGTITVLAAASLTGTFTNLGKQFEAAHPGTRTIFSFGSSSTLATQVTNGAPADVFAAADETTMDTVDRTGQAVGRTDFVSNTLEIAVPAGNPAKITGLKDFADASKKTVLCAKEVPCGSAAIRVFQAAKITPSPVSYETDVKAALTKVSSNEADAALVYTTDVKAAGNKVEGLPFPEAAGATNTYPIATVKDSKNPALATAFTQYVLSPHGQKVLTDAGFGRV